MSVSEGDLSVPREAGIPRLEGILRDPAEPDVRKEHAFWALWIRRGEEDPGSWRDILSDLREARLRWPCVVDALMTEGAVRGWVDAGLAREMLAQLRPLPGSVPERYLRARILIEPIRHWEALLADMLELRANRLLGAVVARIPDADCAKAEQILRDSDLPRGTTDVLATALRRRKAAGRQ